MGSSARAFAFLVETVFQLYLVALMLRVLLEAVRANYYNPVCQVLIKATDPLIKPLKKIIPPAGSINLAGIDRKSTRLNSSHVAISYAVFCLKKKKKTKHAKH